MIEHSKQNEHLAKEMLKVKMNFAYLKNSEQKKKCLEEILCDREANSTSNMEDICTWHTKFFI